MTDTVVDRFLRYVVIDTQSDPSSPTCPSTEKQKTLGRLLAAVALGMHGGGHDVLHSWRPPARDSDEIPWL